MMRCIALHVNEKLSVHNTPTPKITRAYLMGALHDSTERKYTFRICQKSLAYIELISSGILALGFKSWIYKEGRNRDLYIAEFSKKLLLNAEINTQQDKVDYIRGYFDAEGGIPRNLCSRYYIYFAQKNFEDLSQLRTYLLDMGIKCGVIHNPSFNKDPNYFRFFVLGESWEDFGLLIGSYHPVKSKFLRMKI